MLYGNEVWSLQKPPSDDPCAACLGPGFISIMRSIYSVVVTWGEEKSQILLKTQAHPPNPVWKDGLIHWWNSHDMSAPHKLLSCAITGRKTGNWCWNGRPGRRRGSLREYCIGRDYVYAPNLISSQHRMVITFVFTSEPRYITGMWTFGMWENSLLGGVFLIPAFLGVELSESKAPWAVLSPFTLWENEISPFIY